MKPTTPHHTGIHRFISLWLATTLLSFVLLGVGLLFAVWQMRAMTGRVFTEATRLESSYRAKLALVSHRREDLLWRLTGETRHRQHGDALLREAGTLIDALRAGAATPDEAALAQRIQERYRRFRAALARTNPENASTQTPAGDAANLTPQVESLLSALQQHSDFRVRQKAATVRAAKRLNAQAFTFSLSLLALSMLVAGAGGAALYRRILQPASRLAEAARSVGAGDLEARATVLHDDEMGEVCRTFNDMTAVLAAREKDRLHFVATVAHDLRNPLVVIGGAAHLMQKKQLSPDEEVTWLGYVVRNVRHLEDIIGDLHEGVQLQTGQLTLRREECDLTALCDEVVREQAALDANHPLHFSGEACLVRGDRKRLERVLRNLLSNAAKYSAEGRVIEVTLARRAALAVLTVRDEGVGIAPEDLSRLFRPFARLERTRAMAQGTGLGLVSVQKIIHAHGGDIRVQSILGAGTTVEVQLPVYDPAS